MQRIAAAAVAVDIAEEAEAAAAVVVRLAMIAIARLASRKFNNLLFVDHIFLKTVLT